MGGVDDGQKSAKKSSEGKVSDMIRVTELELTES